MIAKFIIARVAGLALIASLISTVTVAQTTRYNFKQVVSPDSIALGKVTSISQDPKGFIWLIDQDNRCLVKYDGSRMVRYGNVPDDPNSLSTGGYEAAFADHEGTVWVGVNRGVDQFDPISGKFKHFALKEEGQQEFVRQIFSILRDRQGFVWAGSSNGLFRLDIKTGKVKRFQHDSTKANSLSSNNIWRIYEDRGGEIWVGCGFPFYYSSDGGLNKYDRKTESFTRYLHDPKSSHSLANNRVSAIFEDSKGVLWVGTSGSDGLQTLNRETGAFQKYPFDSTHPEKLSRGPLKNSEYSDFVSFIQEDEMGVLWIGTSNSGINYYDPGAKKLTHLEMDKGNQWDGAFTSFISHDGVLWVASQWNNPKLFRLDPFGKPIGFTKYKHDAGTGSFFEDANGNLWVGLFGKGTIYKFEQNKTDSPKIISLPNSIAKLPIGNAVTSILPEENGSFLLGTGDGLMFFDPSKNSFTRFNHDSANPSIFKNYISTIYVDRQKQYWICTAWGVTKWDRKTGSLKHFYNDPKDSTSLFADQITSMIQDRAGNFWIGLWSFKGLNRMLPNDSGFKHYLNNYTTNDLFVDASGVFWVATQLGLFRYDARNDRFLPVKFPTSEIEKSDLKTIVEDEHHNLWITSPSALFKIDSTRSSVIAYDQNYGVAPKSVDAPSYITRAGKILFGGLGGFYSFFPRDVEGNPHHPQLVITDLSIDNKLIRPGESRILSNPLDETKALRLAYDQNNFTVGFAGLHFTEPGGNIIFYKLDEYDNGWRKAGSENTASYFKIPSGNYVLRIRAISSAGKATERSLNIVVNPPWWLSWWAYVLYFIGFVVVVYSIYKEERRKIIQRERMKTKERELAQAKEIEKAYHALKETQAQLVQSEKMASLGELTAGIAHEIQNPLNFVNNFSELNRELIQDMNLEIDKGNLGEVRKLARDIAANEEKIVEHGKRADSIVKGMLQHSRVSTGVKELTDINALCDEYLRLCYHGLRAKDKTFNAQLETHFDPALPKLNVVSQDIGRVLLNICNNAFYAANDKRMQVGGGFQPIVKLSTKVAGRNAEIRVEDNGNGISPKIMEKIFQPFFTTKPTGQGTGLGLSMSYDIIKAHGGEIRATSKEGEGTTFIIEIPIAT